MGIEEVEKTPFGAALPPFPGKTEQSIKAYAGPELTLISAHSITLHMPKWATVLQFVDNPQDALKDVKSLYPRFGPFGPVKEVSKSVSIRLYTLLC